MGPTIKFHYNLTSKYVKIASLLKFSPLNKERVTHIVLEINPATANNSHFFSDYRFFRFLSKKSQKFYLKTILYQIKLEDQIKDIVSLLPLKCTLLDLMIQKGW